MQENATGDVTLVNKSEDYGLLALQGPSAQEHSSKADYSKFRRNRILPICK